MVTVPLEPTEIQNDEKGIIGNYMYPFVLKHIAFAFADNWPYTTQCERCQFRGIRFEQTSCSYIMTSNTNLIQQLPI